MEESIKVVQDHYDSDVLKEWERLERHPFEFELTKRMMDRYIKPGDKILDIGGGPGRYSLYYAEKGCDVTLFDLSSGNVEFAKNKAAERKVTLKTVVGDARKVTHLIQGTYDHIFVMGPMYHLIEESDRIKTINAALSLLKKGGNVYISFITMFSGMIFGMKHMPEFILNESEQVFIDSVIRNSSYGGDAFTKAFFTSIHDLHFFVQKFPLKQLHLFGQEGILAPCEMNILAQPKEVIERWMDIAEKLIEREDLLSYSEHVMYIGNKS